MMYGVYTLLPVLFILSGSVYGLYREFDTVPQDTTVIEGTSVVLTCKVLEDYFGFPVYWEVKGSVVNPISTRRQRFTSAGDASRGIHNLKIKYATKSDEGEYRCLIFFNAASIARSTAAKLTVMQIPIPNFVQQPKRRIAIEGGTTTLNCHIDDFTEGKLSVFWQKEGLGLLSRNQFIYDAWPGKRDSLRFSIPRGEKGEFNLKITGVSREDAGDYRCLVSVINGDGYILKSRPARLSVVRTRCYIENATPDRDHYEEGDNVTAMCTARGPEDAADTPVMLSWSSTDASLVSYAKQRETPEIRDSWTLTADDDNKTLLCETRILNPPSFSVCRIGPLRVHFAPIVMILPSAPVASTGGTLSLVCSARAVPGVTDYTWSVNGTTVPHRHTRYLIEKGGQQLSIRSLTKLDNDVKVGCTANNTVKSNYAAVRIQVSEFELSPPTGSPSRKTDGPLTTLGVAPSSFLVIATSVVVVLVLVVFVLVGIICHCQRSRRRRRRNVKMILGEFSHPLKYYTRSTMQSEGDTKQDVSFIDFADPGGAYAEINIGTHTSYATFHAARPVTRSTDDLATTSRGKADDCIYAQVNKVPRRDGERKPADGSDVVDGDYENPTLSTWTAAKPDNAVDKSMFANRAHLDDRESFACAEFECGAVFNSNIRS